MQLKLTVWSGTPTELDESLEFPVRSEPDILKAGFFAAREVRKWLRAMPFVPSRSNLEFKITAEVEDEKAQTLRMGDAVSVPPPKRKRKKEK
jgi:hypothetical protein